jgi:hypothetical protein
MSYSLVSNCNACDKSNECADSAVIQGAIAGLHNMGQNKGHKGCGSITINCSAVVFNAQPVPSETK